MDMFFYLAFKHIFFYDIFGPIRRNEYFVIYLLFK